jgi:hypothetical protein
LYEDVAAELLQSPVNAMRLSLHPRGLAPRIVNLAEWRAHLLYRLRRQVELTADATLTELLREVSAYPGGSPAGLDFAPRARNCSPVSCKIWKRHLVVSQFDHGVWQPDRRGAVRTRARTLLSC